MTFRTTNGDFVLQLTKNYKEELSADVKNSKLNWMVPTANTFPKTLVKFENFGFIARTL